MRHKNMKKFLSLLLVLSMTLGVMSTTAFAVGNDAQDYVYVYVGIDVVETEGAEEFQGEFTGNRTELDKEKNELDNTANTLDATKQNLLENKPEFEEPKDEEGETLTEAIEFAKGEVTGALANLEKAPKPTYPSAETAGEESDTPAAAAEPTFAQGVNGTIGGYNSEQRATEDAAKDDAAKADAAVDQLEKRQETVDAALKEAKGKLEAAQSAAAGEVAKANTAVQACKDEKAKLDGALSTQIADLGERPSETAPVRQEGQSEADYVAAHNAWVQACEDYNEALKPIQEAYDKAVKDLEAKAKEADDAVKAAQELYNTATEDLNAYNRLAQSEYGNLIADAKDIQEIHDKLDAYNKEVDEKANLEKDGYNSVAKEYNDAAAEYNDAVGKYNSAVEDFNNTAVKNHNDRIDELNKAVGDYNTDAGKYNAEAEAYNKGVADYNGEATEWNAEKAKVDLLEAQLKGLNADGITVESVKNALSLSENFEELSDEEYNAKVQEYNKAVVAYNQAVKAFNEALESNTQDVIKNLVSPYIRDDAQTWTTETESGSTHWYTLGKIDVKDAQFAGYIGDYQDTAAGYGDIYTWDTDELDSNGKPKGEAVEGRIPDQLKDDFEAFTSKLEAGANGGNFTADSKTKGDVKELMTDSIHKWVLTSANGANSGTTGDSYVDSGRPAWHLNGYLRVSKLSTLATLEERAVRIADTKKEGIDEKDWAQKEHRIDDTQLETLELYVKLNPEKDAPSITPPDPTTWGQENAKFDKITLDTEVPSELTGGTRLPDPRPTTPPPTEEEEDDDDGPGTTTITEDPTPLAEAPEEVEIPPEEVPLAEEPEEDEVEIPDEDVPLADVPQTGDIASVWYLSALVAMAGLVVLTLVERKERRTGK